MRASSLRTRLTVAVALGFGIVATGAAVLFLTDLERGLVDQRESSDETAAERVAAAISEDVSAVDLTDLPGGTNIIVTGRDGEVLAFGETGEVIALDDVGTSGPTAPQIEPPAPSGPGGIALNPDLPSTSGETNVTAPFVGAGGAGTVVASSSLAAVDDAVARLTASLWWAVPLTTAIVALLVWFVVGRSLRTLDGLTGQVETIRSESLHNRVAVPAPDDEFARLARTLNGMLDRLEEADRTQRQFVSDASHELRTPIATLSARLELALDSDEPNWAETGELALAQTSRLGALVDDLLALAAVAEGETRELVPVDLDEIVYAEAALCGLDVDVSAVGAVRIYGDPQGLRRAVANLLANAARHSASRVSIAVERRGASVMVIVDDDGPGVPDSERSRVFERFARGDESRRASGGSGIGLAVVRSVAQAHGGSVIVTDSPLGGARFALTLAIGDGDLDG